jgi:hypothetical protein
MKKKFFTFLGSLYSEASDENFAWYAIRIDSILRILEHTPAEGENPNLQTEIIFFDERLDNSPIHVYTTGRAIDIALEINE